MHKEVQTGGQGLSPTYFLKQFYLQEHYKNHEWQHANSSVMKAMRLKRSWSTNHPFPKPHQCRPNTTAFDLYSWIEGKLFAKYKDSFAPTVLGAREMSLL